MTDAYGILARYYDKLMGGYNYPEVEAYIASSISGSKGIDLACGTGRMAIALAKRGYHMTGADISHEMLERAMAAAASSGVKIPFVRMDISKPELVAEYDFVTCCCDGINYIRKARLDGALEAIGSHIRRGGVFIFDYSTPYKLNSIIGENIFYEDLAELTYLWTNKRVEDGVRMRLTFFIRSRIGYTREDEEHIQYIYTEEELAGALKRAGFTLAEALDAVTLQGAIEKSERILIKAVKN